MAQQPGIYAIGSGQSFVTVPTPSGNNLSFFLNGNDGNRLYAMRHDRSVFPIAASVADLLWEPGTGSESAKLINTVIPNVASGTHSVAIGENTKATSNEAFAQGNNTTASGPRAAAFGANGVASGENSMVVGTSCTASGMSSFAGGSGSAATNDSAFAYGGGCVASGSNSQAFGDTTIASSDNTHATGRETEASAPNSSAKGFKSLAFHSAETAQASGQFSFSGDAQILTNVLRFQTTDATPSPLFLDGSSEYLTIPVGSAWKFTVDLVGIEAATGDVVSSQSQGVIKNIGGVTTILANVAPFGGYDIQYAQDAGLAATVFGIDTVASTAADALVITVTGEVGKTISWVAGVQLTHVATIAY